MQRSTFMLKTCSALLSMLMFTYVDHGPSVFKILTSLVLLFLPHGFQFVLKVGIWPSAGTVGLNLKMNSIKKY